MKWTLSSNLRNGTAELCPASSCKPHHGNSMEGHSTHHLYQLYVKTILFRFPYPFRYLSSLFWNTGPQPNVFPTPSILCGQTFLFYAPWLIHLPSMGTVPLYVYPPAFKSLSTVPLPRKLIATPYPHHSVACPWNESISPAPSLKSLNLSDSAWPRIRHSIPGLDKPMFFKGLLWLPCSSAPNRKPQMPVAS